MSEKFLTADQTVCAFFEGVMEPVDIRDEKGQLVGRFIPRVSAEDEAVYEMARKKYDKEEIDRRKREESASARTTAEVLHRLQQLERQACDSR